jgi:hypothetical protein
MGSRKARLQNMIASTRRAPTRWDSVRRLKTESDTTPPATFITTASLGVYGDCNDRPDIVLFDNAAKRDIASKVCQEL